VKGRGNLEEPRLHQAVPLFPCSVLAQALKVVQPSIAGRGAACVRIAFGGGGGRAATSLRSRRLLQRCIRSTAVKGSSRACLPSDDDDRLRPMRLGRYAAQLVPQQIIEVTPPEPKEVPDAGAGRGR